MDYRPLNAITVVDTYTLPRIDEMIDKAGGAKIYSKLDLHAGFHQIRIHPEPNQIWYVSVEGDAVWFVQCSVDVLEGDGFVVYRVSGVHWSVRG